MYINIVLNKLSLNSSIKQLFTAQTQYSLHIASYTGYLRINWCLSHMVIYSKFSRILVTQLIYGMYTITHVHLCCSKLWFLSHIYFIPQNLVPWQTLLYIHSNKQILKKKSCDIARLMENISKHESILVHTSVVPSEFNKCYLSIQNGTLCMHIGFFGFP